jgi:hypothetical protein
VTRLSHCEISNKHRSDRGFPAVLRRRLPKRALWGFAAFVAFAVAGSALFLPKLQLELRIDECLDRGGRWNYEEELCDDDLQTWTGTEEPSRADGAAPSE